MNTKIFITVFVLMFGFTNIEAQKRMNKETKIVLVVSEKTNLVTNLAIYAEMQDLMNTRGKTLISKKYPNSKFYLGLLKGDYKVERFGLGPVIGTLITIYTNKELFAEDRWGTLTRWEISIREML